MTTAPPTASSTITLNVAQIMAQSGMRGTIANSETDGYGLHVMAMQPVSPAERAGIQSGDIIVEADGKSLKGLNLVATLALLWGEPGTEVEVKI